MVPLREAKPSKRAVAGVVKRVVEQLGNTPVVCRKSYIHPRRALLFSSQRSR